MTKDLTSVKTLIQILNFSIPVLFWYLFQQFYNVVDTIIVGKSLGVEALAAVGATGSVNFLILGFCVGLCSGFAIPVAQSFGALDYRKMRRFLYNAEILAVGFSVAVTALTVIFCRPLLQMMQTPPDIIDRAVQYILIIFWGIPFIFLFNMVASILRAVGDSRTPLFFLVVSSILNIALDLVFILVFHWDVAGAALATVVSQGAAGVVCLFYMKRKFVILKLNHEDKVPDRTLMKSLCGAGIPMGLQYSITAIGAVVLQSSLNALGAAAVAAVTAAQRIQMFFNAPYDALGTTMATFGGQNAGARKWDRLKEGVFKSSLLGLIYSIISLGIMILFGRHLGMLFVDGGEAAIISDIHRYLVINGFFFFPLALVNIVRFMIQGMGFSSFAILSGVLEMIGRGAAAVFLVPAFGFAGVALAGPLAWILADVFLIPAFYYCLGRLRQTPVEERLVA
ncbi:MAG: MATE family efflux transporter [Spirochaetales bacterium]|nr:MATE family efflux transporter [Spirochaetales bacterium]